MASVEFRLDPLPFHLFFSRYVCIIWIAGRRQDYLTAKIYGRVRIIKIIYYMNYYSIFSIIKTGSHEQRERLFEELQNKSLGEKYLCRYFSCKRKGECDIEFGVSMRGGFSKEVYDIVDLPLVYPDVTEEVWTSDETCPAPISHRLYTKDFWEEIWTLDDAIGMYERYDSFHPSMLELETYRKAYDIDGNLITEEHKIVPFPIEKMPDAVRVDYERWKDDPQKWEEGKKKEEERQEALSESRRLQNIDDLPF